MPRRIWKASIKFFQSLGVLVITPLGTYWSSVVVFEALPVDTIA